MRQIERKIKYSLLVFVRMHGQDGSGARLSPCCNAHRRKAMGSKLQGVDQCGQATKGVWGMPWHQKAMKGVEDCEKPGGSVKRELIPGSLN